jgi:molybdate transport system substrate-binding protein
MTSKASTLLAAALAWLLFHATGVASQEHRGPPLLVFAAASLTDVLDEHATEWERVSGMPVKFSFAASSVLARQVEAGGRADVFVSADQEWMDYLEQRSLIDGSTRRDLAGNRLVLIAPRDSKVALRIAPGFALAAALGRGRLSTGDPDTVPAGRYARSALVALGSWEEIQQRLVRADNVRSAMMFVARGEAPLGIVYATDARVEPQVRVVDTFPQTTHAPITYPAAATRGSRQEARAFLDYLASAAARDTWKKHGFVELTK